MDYRNFKNEKVSLLGMGCMRLPVIDDKIDQAHVEKMVAYAFENGVNYFDTAYYYHNGQSELAIGKALKAYDRDKFFLADKMPSWDLSDESMAPKRFEEQLKKCGVEYFDFYLAHNLNRWLYPPYKKYKVLEFLAKMKEEGKIRYLGFSFHDNIELLKQICSDFDWDFAQIQLNYLDWELQDAKTQYEILSAYNLPVIVMEPVRGGSLHSLCPEAKDLLNKLDPQKSTASWALRWAAQKENVFTVLSGMSNSEQLADNIKTLSPLQKLSEKEEKAIEQALEIFKKYFCIPCTKCHYCNLCPMGIDIPEVIRVFNQYKMSGNEYEIKDGYNRLQNKPESCIACGSCSSHCPQMIDIPLVMQEFYETAKPILEKDL